MSNPENILHYVIGDVHGCFNEYTELEQVIYGHAEKNNAKPFIISVGDLIDRGPDSSKLIRHFTKGAKNKTHIAIMGNHEMMMLETLQAFTPENFSNNDINYPNWFMTYNINFKKGKGMAKHLSWEDYLITIKSMWITQGGYDTLKSFGCDPHKTSTWKISKEDLSFMVNMPLYYENNDVIVTHALANRRDIGVVREVLPTADTEVEENEVDVLRNSFNSLLWSRTLPTERPSLNKLHVSGHTPFSKVKNHKKISCTQIDTACVYGGKLTALCIESGKFLFVKARKNYLLF